MTNKNLVDVIPVELLNQIDKLDADYKKYTKIKNIILYAIITISTIIGIISLLSDPNLLIIVIPIVVVVFIIFGIFFMSKNILIEADFKHQIVGSLIPQFFDNHKGIYEPQSYLSEQELRESEAISANVDIDAYAGEDLMTFETDSFNLKMSEINARDKQTYREKGETKTRWVTVASGFLGKITKKSPHENEKYFRLNLNYNKPQNNNFSIIFAGIVLGIILILFIDSFYGVFNFSILKDIFVTNIGSIVAISFIPAMVLLINFTSSNRKRNKKDSPSSSTLDINRKWEISLMYNSNPNITSMINSTEFQTLVDKFSVHADTFTTFAMSVYFHKDCIYFYIPNINLFVPKITKELPTILNCLESDIEFINKLVEFSEFIVKFDEINK